MKQFLHVGCGSATKASTTPGFNTDARQEVCFDIDKDYAPHIIGTIVDTSGVATGSMDAIFSSHRQGPIAGAALSIARAGPITPLDVL